MNLFLALEHLLTEKRCSFGITITYSHRLGAPSGRSRHGNYHSRDEENCHDDEGEDPLERDDLSEELGHTDRSR